MSIPASNARANFFKLIEQVNDDQEAVLITSNAGNAVLVSESEWENMLETVYLLGHPESRRNLDEARAQISAGKVTRIEFSKGNVFEEMKVLSSRSKKKVTK
ncbi:MAG: type II toxin-antitoxin system Phd/YefM family antitoxin [Candidatus Planktophila sp.]